MAKLFLYSIFHANLKFSSIPEDQYGQVIDKCYWPVIDLVSEYKHLKLGIEFPSTTLRQIESIDPLLIEQIKKLAAKGRIEVLASGFVQCLFPLIPESINEQNLKLGLNDYRDTLGITPKSAYLNEQAFSSGLPALYSRMGISNLVLMWEWLVKFSNSLITDYSPQKIRGADGTRINAIMNSYIAFQKFQRYIANEMDLKTYESYVRKHLRESSKTCFPFYGSDWEIFGYKNTMLFADQAEEISRFKKFVEAVQDDKDISFATPAEIIDLFPPRKEITVDSPEAAIYLKKQDKFIISRWAVCGRDNSLSNTLCYDIHKNIGALEGLYQMQGQSKESIQGLKSELIDCWASDNRTHTTESKYTRFKLKLGDLTSRVIERRLEAIHKVIKDRTGKLSIVNYTDQDWVGLPFECKMHFPPHRYSDKLQVYVNEKEVPSQLEESQFYGDGSLRTARVVMLANVPRKSIADLEVMSQGDIKEKKPNAPDDPVEEIDTPSTKISFLRNRGGTIEKLIFKNINKHPLMGWLEHGFYKDTRLSADFYTGHMIAFDRTGAKFTDLTPVSAMFSTQTNDHPIRIPVYCLVNTPIGTIEKIYYIYTEQPRVDLVYRLNLKEFQPSSFRLGIITLNPLAYDPSKMEFSTNNGGYTEKFLVSGNSIAYDESVDPRVSSHGCLGATEEWLDVGDSRNGITLFSDKAKCYNVPLINYQETKDDLFFYRIYNSICELDDTTMTWWKGQKIISFSILGRKGRPDSNINQCRQLSKELLAFSQHPLIRLMEN